MNPDINFLSLITGALVLLLADLWLWMQAKRTFSDTIWAVNQWTLAIAFAAGLICGHLFTVPGLP